MEQMCNIQMHSMLCSSATIAAVLADTSEALPGAHAGAPHAAASTEEKLTVAVRTTETRQLRNIGDGWLDHTSALRETFKRAPGIAYILRGAAANAIDRADASVSVFEGWRGE